MPLDFNETEDPLGHVIEVMRGVRPEDYRGAEWAHCIAGQLALAHGVVDKVSRYDDYANEKIANHAELFLGRELYREICVEAACKYGSDYFSMMSFLERRRVQVLTPA